MLEYMQHVDIDRATWLKYTPDEMVDIVTNCAYDTLKALVLAQKDIVVKDVLMDVSNTDDVDENYEPFMVRITIKVLYDRT